MTISFYSATLYQVPAEGPVTDPVYTFNFPYIHTDHVYVYVDGTLLLYSPTTVAGRWEFAGPQQVRINATLPAGTKVVIRRFTRKDSRLAEYSDGSVLTEFDLNILARQYLYLIQELYDYLGGVNTGNPLPGGPGIGLGDPDGETPTIIDEIINELLQSQLFQDLVELIELVDINAETVLANTLAIHEQWGRDRTYEGLIRELDSGLADVDARITQERIERIDGDSAQATLITAVQARMGAAEADIITNATSIASVDSALTSYITVAESRFDGAEARIGTIETTYASLDYTETFVQSQLDARFAPAALSGALNATSVIQGILARNDADAASIASVASYIAGSGVTMNPDGTLNWPDFNSASPGSIAKSLATAQTTLSIHASQLAATSSLRTALASAFAPGTNVDDPAAMNGLVSAMQDEWETYADVHSTTAQAVQTLQSNTRPILFRTTAPNPYTDAGFEPYRVNGFPDGTLWYKTSGNTVRPFWWDADRTSASGYDVTYGPFRDASNVPRPGIWLPATDAHLEEVLGARIDNVTETSVFRDRVDARIENKLVTTFFGPSPTTGENISAVNAISQRLVSYIDAEEGSMYSSWNVRINQYHGSGTPVIAGVGLGMQTDLNNPERSSVSQFIVMADQFALIKPVSVPLEGSPDLSTVEVPFVIDGPRNKVIVNSTLLARSMRLLDGYGGRLVFTEMNPITMEPVSATGPRLVLPSSTSNWNASNSASPFAGGSNPQRFLLWAGSGTMNHNNATFYVDTDGNAFFGGEVDADNVNGSMSDAKGLSVSANVTAPAGGALVQVGGIQTLQGSSRSRKVMAVVSISMFGSGQYAGRGVLQMKAASSGSWTTVADSTISIPYGGTLSLSGGLPSAVAGDVELRVMIGAFDGYEPTTNGYSGIFMAVR